MNIDYKQYILESQQRLAKLAEIEQKLNELPQHLRAIVPHLDAIVEVASEIHGLDRYSAEMLPKEVHGSLSFLRLNSVNLRNALLEHGNRFIAAVEPAPSVNE